jgi:shikimate kinase
MNKTNIILIGMPGAGKSTIGIVLAKRLGRRFLDTDVEIQVRQGRRLQDIIDRDGLSAFCEIEEQTLLALNLSDTVIATGGSVVYSEKAMTTLKRTGCMVFLDLPFEVLAGRIRDMDSRGMVIDPGESFADLYCKRLPLYRRWAELTVDCRGKSVEEIAAIIADWFCRRFQKKP